MNIPRRRRGVVSVVAAVGLAAIILTAFVACRSGPSTDSRAAPHGAATVSKVVDGDTIRVRLGQSEERVRLIGIDTPETSGRGGLKECFGLEATRRLVALLPEGTSVRLVRDVEPRDRYGRLLAYVYRLPDELFVNLTLAQEGYADTLNYPPNVAHAEDLRRATFESRQARRGMWGGCHPP